MKQAHEGEVTLLERIAIAVSLALAGFLTAILARWLLTPPISLSMDAFLKIGAARGVIFFLYGLVRPEHAVDQLGAIWKFLWRISHEVLKYFSLFRR